MGQATRTEATTAAAQGGLFRNGWRELKRKSERRGLKKQLQQIETQRIAALGQVGESAWKAQVDLSRYPGFQEQFARLESRAGELSTTAKKLAEEKGALESRRQSETAKFDGQRQEVETKKRPVDAALQAAKDQLRNQNQIIQRLEARSTALPGEIAAHEQQMAALMTSGAPEKAAQLSAAQDRKLSLEQEQKQAAEQLRLAQQALPSIAAEVQRLYDESQGHAAELNRIEGERKSALAPVVADLERVQRALGAAGQEAGAVQKEQQERFVQLGQAIYDSRAVIPAIATSLVQVVTIDRNHAAAQAALDASVQQTREMPRGTMLKFAGVLLGAPILVLGFCFAAYAGLEWWRVRHAPPELQADAEVNAYLNHSLSGHPAYTLARQLATATTQQEVEDRMKTAFAAINLGVYTPDGRRILAGSERDASDFFLYDFQLRILARAFLRRNVGSFSAHTQMLGRSLLGMDHPEELEPALRRAIAQRYRDARSKPDDPVSFLILLVDGLARNQAPPYSLEEIAARPGQEMHVDPLQSLLIMLDFFTKAPRSSRPPVASPAARLLQLHFPWEWETTAYAQAPCGGVSGNGNDGNWGNGSDLMPQPGQPGGPPSDGQPQAGSSGGSKSWWVATHIPVVGGLITLYAINIEIKPSPSPIHMQHPGTVPIETFSATVTLDLQSPQEGPIPCGGMAGQSLPSGAQPLKGAELTWTGQPDWSPYFEFPSPEVDLMDVSLGFRTKTDLNGKSIFFLQARECPDKQGSIQSRTLQMTVAARVLTTKIPLPAVGYLGAGGKVIPGGVEYFMGGRTGSAMYTVEWHKKKPKQYGQK